MKRLGKKINTFHDFQDEKQSRREALISTYLGVMSKSKVRVKYLTHLAKLVSEHISQVEGTPCYYGTFLRNARYESLLLGYMATVATPGTKDIQGLVGSDLAMQALLLNTQLEAANLKRELNRVKAHLSELKCEAPYELRNVGSSSSTEDVVNFQEQLILTCQMVMRVFTALDGLVSIDMDMNRILDASRRTDNVIADARLATPFIEWLQSNNFSI